MRDASADDGLLVDWLAHYAALMLIIIVVITAGATAWAAFVLPSREMWTIVVDSTQDVPARELGVVGEALFQAEATSTEAMAALGLTGGPEQLYRFVQLRAVPESRLLIVVARTDDLYTASSATDAMAQALVHAFERSGYTGMRVLGAPQPAPVASGLSVGVVALAAVVMGVILAFGIAIVSYRMRRPVLTMERATALVDPLAVASIPGTARALGSLRRRPPRISRGSLRLAAPFGDGTRLQAPGFSERDRRKLARSLGVPARSEGARAVIACDAATRERDLRAVTSKNASPLELLWIA
ncbi:MAG: hypothetical protein WD096_05730 [Actinomycetota bacterium]